MNKFCFLSGEKLSIFGARDEILFKGGFQVGASLRFF